MATWTQYIYVNGEASYEPLKRTAEEMVDLLVQIHLLKQSGENITITPCVDNMWNVVTGSFNVTRVCGEYKTIYYEFVKGE